MLIHTIFWLTLTNSPPPPPEKTALQYASNSHIALEEYQDFTKVFSQNKKILFPPVTDLIWDAFRNLTPFVQFKKNMKNTHGGGFSDHLNMVATDFRKGLFDLSHVTN